MSQNGTRFVFGDGQKGRRAEALIVPLISRPTPAMELVAGADALCDGAVSEAMGAAPLREETGGIIHTTRPAGYRRILIVGLGEAEKLTRIRLRNAAAQAAHWLRKARCEQAAVWVDGLLVSGAEEAVGEWCGAMTIAGFAFDELRGREADGVADVRVQFVASDRGQVKRIMPEVERHQIIAGAINYGRRLGHLPANVLNPDTLAAEAKSLAQGSKLKCTILSTEQIRRLKMGGLLAVGAGAEPGPCLIQLEYRGAPKVRRTTVLIGKAVTFDTGGYSIKPSAGLETLKFDKCGGVNVMAIMKAVAELKLLRNVTALIPAAENAVSDRAYRPGDILTMMSGKTVEVISTDAEGRLILADALWYAQQKLKPTEIIDLATLTGGARVALGTAAAGLMSNHDDLAGELGECGRRTGERLWRLPLWDEYRELIKGVDSDIRNSASKRDAHMIVGGMFLKEFVGDVPWAHVDIAAVATTDEKTALFGKGATGFGVRLMVDYLQRRG